MPLNYNGQTNIDARMCDGAYLGTNEDTVVVLIGTEYGITMSRTIKRRPWKQRRPNAYVKSNRGSLGKPYEHTADGTLRCSPPANVDGAPNIIQPLPTNLPEPDAN